MFKKYKKKILEEVLNELEKLREDYDIKQQVEKEIDGKLNDYSVGVGSGIRKSISKVYEMYYDNTMTKERAERTFGIKIVDEEVYSKEVL